MRVIFYYVKLKVLEDNFLVMNSEINIKMQGDIGKKSQKNLILRK